MARSPEAARSYNNLGATVWALGDFRRACTLYDEAVAFGERLGNTAVGKYARITQIQFLFGKGEWEEGLRRADEFLSACETGESHYLESTTRLERARVRLARGDVEGALDDGQKALGPARGAGDPQMLVPGLAGVARLYAETGRIEEARPLAGEALAEASATWALADLAWVAVELDCTTGLRVRLERSPLQTKWGDAMHALLRRDFRTAAEVFYDIGTLDDEAVARLRAAEQLVAEGRRAEADEQLQRSLGFWRSVGATRYIQEGEALLAKSA